MPYRAMALVAASVLTLSGSALAQKIEPTTDSKNLNSSRSNVNRDGSATSGGGAGVTTVKGSKSNSSDRMGGGGGTKAGGAVQLNPQPEPPGSKAK
jgi:hypothetical protein